MAEHKDILSDGAHVIHYWEVADSTALSALTPIIAELNKIALKVDDNTFWQCTEISPATFKLLNEISAEDIKTKYESNADTNALTDALLALLNTNKVKNVTTDAVNDKLVITYTDDTTAELNVTGGSDGEVDLANYYTKSETYNKGETDSLINTKQDTLVSGTSIKTINGQSVLGSGGINLEGLSELASPKLGIETLTEFRHPVSGKPLYTKTIDCGFLPAVKTVKVVPLNITDDYDYVKVLTDSSHIVIPGVKGFSFSVLMPWYTLESQIGTYIDEGSIVIGVGMGQSNKKAYVTVEYTKTTDTAESPVRLIGGGSGGDVDLTDYYTKAQADSLVDTKQDTLVSGTSIKTINGSNILSNGNLALLDATNPSITGSITEQVYNLTGTVINPANGTIQYKTITANTTFTETLASGQSVLLRLIGANGKTITFPTITWVGAAAPTLTANCAIVLWKEQSVLYGAFVGTLV